MNTGSISRRSLFKGELARTPAILPPGVSRSSLTRCTGCNQCVERCPSSIIQLTGGLPEINLSGEGGECTFCRACLDACTQAVFDGSRFHFNHVATVSDQCLARKGVACQSCGESCPEQAIGFEARIGGPFVPAVDSARCTGCAACMQVCPMDAIVMQPLKEFADG
ncbi:ferredoxin-type protein NapF [Rhizobium sp. Root708]|uniref:ferredoxin-type protein NapF n=1 Tax=Rhizobium sp. Root708 TaxID=1736592 RepID=UPI000AA2A1C9|nr:ferredoxin-type protein NapF [Rhizobium sp. Root708]